MTGIVIPDGGTIGSASDTDAISVASDGQVTIENLKLTPSSQPASASTGEIYYDSSKNKLKFYNGSKWAYFDSYGEYETAGATINNTAVSGYDLIVFTAGDGTSSYKFKPLGAVDIDLLIVSAGGGTPAYGGGGGGGQVITHTGITVHRGSEYYITVGTGSANANGGDSFFKHSDGSTVQYQAIGGGRGSGNATAFDGGSGGGAGSSDSSGTGGSSIKDTSHTSFSGGTINNYGNAGGNNNTASPYPTGGGGGAGAVGGNASSGQAGNGGNGIDVSATFGTAYGDSGVFGGGGGGMLRSSSGFGTGGSGGGGRGGTSTGGDGVAGTANTGGGAGGQGTSGSNLAGGSGIVIIRVAR